jgi:hypothetical protein
MAIGCVLQAHKREISELKQQLAERGRVLEDNMSKKDAFAQVGHTTNLITLLATPHLHFPRTLLVAW